MRNDFTQETLSDCLEKVIDYRGKTPKKLGGDWSKTGFRAISADNVKTIGLSSQDSIRFVDQTLYKKWMKEEIQPGDILLTSEAPAGQVMVWNSPEKIVLSQRVFGLRVHDKLDSWYLKYYLQSNTGQREIYRNNSGSTVFGVSAETFANILVRYPQKAVQNKIGRFLSSLDFKIELSSRINTELEGIAKTLYDYWFAQYDFPDNQNHPFKASGGKLSYCPTLKRKIPNGWEPKVLKDFIALDKGGDWGQDSLTGKHTHKVNCIRGADFPALSQCITPNAPVRFILEKNKSSILAPGDLIVEISGGSPVQSTGRICYINNGTLKRFDSDTVTSNFCKAISLRNPKFTYIFYFEWQRLYSAGVFFNYEGKTTGLKNLLFDIFINSYITAAPPDSLVEKFHNTVSPLFETIQHNALEAQELAKLRDWMLPMLINGQVKIN